MRSVNLILRFVAIAAAQKLEFTMSVSPPPEPGSRFNITWAPVVAGRLTIRLNSFDPLFLTFPIITTSRGIASEDTLH